MVTSCVKDLKFPPESSYAAREERQSRTPSDWLGQARPQFGRRLGIGVRRLHPVRRDGVGGGIGLNNVFAEEHHGTGNHQADTKNQSKLRFAEHNRSPRRKTALGPLR